MPYPRRWAALGVLSLSLVVISLDNTILNVALPAIREDTGASAGQLQWIVDAYLLVFAGLLLTAGALGDRFGRRRLLLGGLVVFGAASAAAAVVTDPAALIAVRAVMGIGGAAIMPSTLSIVTAIFPPDERPRAIAVWAAVAGLGIVIGPVAGGALVEHADWGWVFLVNVPVVLLALGLGRWLVPESRDEDAPRLDVPGAVLSVGVLASLVWAVIEGPARGWTDGLVLGAFAAAGVLAVLFAVVELRTADPMLDLRFFRDARFGASSAAIAFAFFALFGTMFFLTQYLQVVLGKAPLDAGLWALPAAGGVMLLAAPAARLDARFGTKLPVTLGLTILAGGMAWLSTAGTEASAAWLIGTQFTIGAGIGLAMAPATDAIMGSLPLAKVSVGSAVNDTNRIVGGALGVAVLGSLLTSGYRGAMEPATHALPPAAADAARDSVAGAAEVAAGLGGGAGDALRAAAAQAFVDGLATATLTGAGVAALGALLALRFLPSRAAAKAAVAPVAVTA